MDIGEITLIGTGGYGECILVNLGNDNWIIVDSCIDPEIGTPLSIEYLDSIGVASENVKLIVCTHWHDDHIRGISQALEKCINAKLSFSRAHDTKKFLYFLSFDYQKRTNEKLNSSTYEFNKCIDIIQARAIPIAVAIENRNLISVNINALTNKVYSISPSDYTMEKFDHEIGSLITEFGSPNKKLPADSPNAKSVALYLEMGYHRAILGADLEISRDDREGWMNIVLNNTVIDNEKLSSLFKIPHHGSANGFCENVWSNLLEKNPVAKLTPWNRGNGLPQREMLKKYSQNTEKLFMTNRFTSSQPKKRDKQIDKYLKKIGKELEEVKYKKGIIRCRIDMADPNAEWEVELIENSTQIKVDEIDN